MIILLADDPRIIPDGLTGGRSDQQNQLIFLIHINKVFELQCYKKRSIILLFPLRDLRILNQTLSIDTPDLECHTADFRPEPVNLKWYLSSVHQRCNGFPHQIRFHFLAVSMHRIHFNPIKPHRHNRKCRLAHLHCHIGRSLINDAACNKQWYKEYHNYNCNINDQFLHFLYLYYKLRFFLFHELVQRGMNVKLLRHPG